jgi:peptidoglycan/LPS O-acetylase OafA/YrhL
VNQNLSHLTNETIPVSELPVGLKRIPELDGIRGVLAWWVVAIHTLEFTGWNSTPMVNLFHPMEVVSVFIILSGFVIFFLLDTFQETFSVYILRRAFRLFPVYIIVLFAAVACMPIVEANSELNPAFEGFRGKLVESTSEFFPWHLAAHLPLLHGIVPEKWLPLSSVAILPPAWSVSLEWQFYLIAPLVAGLVRHRFAWAAALLGVVVVEWLRNHTHVPRFSTPSFLPLNYRYFLLGMASFYFYKWLAMPQRKLPWPSLFYPVVVTLCCTFLLKDQLAVGVWILVIVPIILKRCSSLHLDRLSDIVVRTLSSGSLQFIGKISFVTYLSHELLLQSALYVFYRNSSSEAQLMPFGLLAATGWPAILLVSVSLHWAVERPFISFARSITQRRPTLTPVTH